MCPLELAVAMRDRMSVDYLSCLAKASSMVVVVGALASTVVIVRRQPNALEVVVTPSRNPYTLAQACHDTSEDMVVVLTTSLECCQT